MPKLGCARCGLVLDTIGTEATATRPCHRCASTMRPVSGADATTLRALAGTRGLRSGARLLNAARGPRSGP
jgi:hypothetical protein